MRNKFSFIIVTITLLFLALSAFSQDDVSTIDKLLTSARERQRVAREAYTAAEEGDRTQKERDALKANWQKANEEVNDLLKVKATLPPEKPADAPKPAVAPATAAKPSLNTDRSNDSDTNKDDADSGDKAVTKSDGETVTETSDNTIDDCRNRNGVFSSRICDIAENVVENRGDNLFLSLSDNKRDLALVIYGQLVGNGIVTASDANKNFILDAEEKRTDKQIGSDANAKGTTSIVVKGGVPSFLNFATENGAAIRSISGTTVTFRFNPLGVLQTMTNPRGFLESYAENFTQVANPKFTSFTATPDEPKYNYKSKFSNYLRKLAIGLSFDASRNQEIPTLTADDRQLSAISLRYEFVNDRDPRNPKWNQKWEDFFDREGGKLVADLSKLDKAMFERDEQFQISFKNPALKDWFEELKTAVGKLPVNSSIATVEAVIKGKLAELTGLKLADNAELVKAFDEMTKLFIAFNKKQDELLSEIAKAPVATFEYTNYREPVLPDTHNFRFIFAKGFALGKAKDSPVLDFTFNASLTFLNKKPMEADVKRLRDFSFAGQVDVPLGFSRDNSLYGSTFSFAGKYERVVGDITALDGTVIPSIKGDIWVGQAKLTLPIGKYFGISGIDLPISATFANRTELIKESHVRGNFGITFDIDKLILSNILKNIR